MGGLLDSVGGSRLIEFLAGAWPQWRWEVSTGLRHHGEAESERTSQAQVTQEQWSQGSSRPWWDAGFQAGSALEEGREEGTQSLH